MKQFNKKLDLNPYLDGEEIVATSIAYDGSLLVATVAADKSGLVFGKVENSFATFPKSCSDEQYGISVLRFSSELVDRVLISNTQVSYPKLQVFPGGSILLVGSRCRNIPEGPELNAAVYNAEGDLEKSFCAGDGIEDVQISEHGDIWISYFDEGIFGNYGWNEPIGSFGLNCFNRSGDLTWRFTAPEKLDAIADCYAMNVHKDDVWLCYYTDFPIVRVDKNRAIHAWSNEVSGARAIAVDGNRVLLFGGYGEDKKRCIIQSLSTSGKAVNRTEYTIKAPFDISATAVMARGADLNAIHEGTWYQLSMGNIA